jgi:hypothetical protein
MTVSAVERSAGIIHTAAIFHVAIPRLSRSALAMAAPGSVIGIMIGTTGAPCK